jgi:hypothetical protein
MRASEQSQTADSENFDQDGRIRRPELLPEFTCLVRRAISVQHGSLTVRQYEKLRRQFFLAKEPVSSPMFGWAIGNELLLHRALAREGVSVRVEATKSLHPYRLSNTGLRRLGEIETKIKRTQKRAEKTKV